MSTTVDSRVLEMRFDNKQFERNVATSMSTLEKLKQKLNLSGASKGLNDISAAAKKFDMSGMGTAVDTVSARFSALQVMGVTALANITNSAVNAGKRIVSALTIDPIKIGMQEYETQLNAVQTILSNTKQEGTNVDIVNAALDELNAYADKTIYNFTEMTRNIGTFTAAGVKLQTSVDAIKGIANLAAVSGSSSQQASTAMYQLSQALAAGKISLMDWNSVVNAGMGGKVFQDALVRTSELLGTGAKQAIETSGTFRESLTSTGWLTTEVLTETLKQFAGAYSEADLIAQGFNEEQAKEIADMAKTADEAATKVKTLTQLWDVLKEAAQSGWAQTWRLIIGDFDEAKELFTGLSDTFTGIIGNSADRRNSLLSGALTSNWDRMTAKINEAGIATTDFEEKVSSTAEKAGYDVSGLIKQYGSLKKAFQNGAISSNILNKALAGLSTHTTDLSKVTKELDYGAVGEDVEQVQKALQSLGYEFSEFGMDGTLGKETEAAIKAFQEANNLEVTGIVDDSTIAKLKEATGETKDLTQVCKGFVGEIDKVSGRELLIGSLQNSIEGVLRVARSLGAAWRQVFPPMKSDQLYNILEGLNQFSEKLLMSSETTAKLKMTFQGLFAVLDIIAKITGGGLKIGFEVLKQVLAAFDLDILDVTANVGNAIYKFNEWIEKNSLIKKGVELAVPAIIKMGKAVADWIKSLTELPAAQSAVSKVTDFFTDALDRIGDFIDRVKELDNISLDGIVGALKESFNLDGLFDGVGEDAVAGLINGLNTGIDKAVAVVIEIGSSILSAIKGVLGIHSPSTEMQSVGENTIEGLYNGLKSGISNIVDVLNEIGGKIKEVLGTINWDNVFAGGVIAGFFYIAKKIANTIGLFAKPFVSFANLLDSTSGGVAKTVTEFAGCLSEFSGCLKGFQKVLKSIAFENRSEGIKNLAIAIAILAGSIAVLSLLDPKKLWSAVAMVAVLAAILVALAVAMDKLTTAGLSIDKQSKTLNMKSLSSGLIGIASAVMILAYAVKVMGSLNPEQLKQGFAGLAGIIASVALVMLAFWGLSKLCKGSTADFGAMGSSLIKMSIALLVLVGVVKLVGMLSPDEMKNGAKFAGAFVVFVGVISAITRLLGRGEINKLGGLVLKLSFAMLLLVGVAKLAGTLSEKDMYKGGAFAMAFLIFVGALTGIARVAGAGNMGKLGGLLLSISVAMTMMVGVCKLATLLDRDAAIKGGIFAIAFLGFVWALVKITKIGKEEQIAKMSTTILAISVALGILAGICILLGMIDDKILEKGVRAVVLLGGIMAAMIWATRGANKCVSNLIAMTVAIGVIAAAVVALSFIDPTQLAGATAAMGVLMAIFTVMVKVAGTAKTALAPTIAMMAVIGVLSAVLYLLAGLPIKSTLGVTAALSILLLTMTGVFVVLGTVGGLTGTAITGALGMMAVLAIIGGLALAIGGLMSLIPQDKIETWKTGLQNFMDFLVILSGGLGEALGAFIGGALAGVMSGLPSIGSSLSLFMSNLAPFLNGIKMVDASVAEGADFLAKAIGALTVAQLINGLTNLLGFAPSLANLGLQLGAFGMNLIPFTTAMKYIDSNAVNSVANLGSMVTALTGAGILEGIASFITGTSSMEKFGTQLTQFADAIIPFSNRLNRANIDASKIQAATNAGLLLTELGNAIPKSGGFLQDIIGESDWGKFNTGIACFGAAIVAFNTALGTTTIDEGKVTVATSAGKALTEVQKAIPKSDGFLQDVIGESDWGKFNTGITCFGSAIAAFNTALGTTTIDEDKVNSVVNAGKALAEVQNAIPKSDGFLQDIIGESDWGKFNTSIVGFGEAIAQFNTSIGDAKIDETKIAVATNAGLALTEVQKAIPEEHWLDGKVSLEDFGGKIKTFGEAMSAYSTSVSSVDEGKIGASVSAAYRIANFIKSIADMDGTNVNAFSPTGGGDGWAKNIGQAIGDFCSSVGDIDPTLVGKALSIAYRLKSFIAGLASFDGSGTDEFEPKDIGEAIKDYAKQVDGIDAEKVASSVTSALRLKTFMSGLSNLDSTGVSNFKISEIGTAMQSYSTSISGINVSAVSSSISIITRLKTLIGSLSGMDASGVDTFKTAVSSLGQTDFSSVANSMKGAASSFSSVGTDMMDSISKGLKSKQSSITSTASGTITSALKAVTSKASAFGIAGSTLARNLVTGLKSQASKARSVVTSAMSSAASGIRGYRGSFYSAGGYLGDGLVSGINAKKSAAYSAGYALGQAAVKGEKEGQQSNSPSKLTIQAGEWLGEGLVIGIQKMGSKVYNAGHNLGDSAASSMSSAISKVSDFVSSGMDTQPTIRPVVDLTDVRAGTNAINGMMNINPAFSASTNLGAISSMMSRRNQNGTNGDVVSAIDKLRKEVGAMDKPSYSINGINYTESSDVAEAIQTIARAALMERRV